MSSRKIPEAVIRRLPRYYRYLKNLMDMGISRVSSKDLSTRIGITSSQVRQDFYCFGSFGTQGFGYEVEYLYYEIKKILGLDTDFNMVIVGAGNLGQALSKYMLFQKSGFKVAGIFDNDPELIGKKIGEIEIMYISDLNEFIKNNCVDIAALTVPAINAREVAEYLVSCGIKGIWNFAPIELKLSSDVFIENIHLTDSLMILGYKTVENTK